MNRHDEEPMSAEGWLPILGLLLFLDLLALIGSAVISQLRLVSLAAATFAAVIGIVAIVANTHYWHGDRSWTTGDRRIALVSNTRLLALAYFWGALAMQGLYITPMTGLKWQHGWQYAAAMLLLSLLSLAYAWKLDRGREALRRVLDCLAVPLTMFQGLGAAAGIAALLVTGKIFTWRADWAANQIFLFGALLVMVLSAVTLRTHKSLGAPKP